MKLRGIFVVLETQVDKCSATPGWAVCGVTVFLAVPRYGQMTAGSYCYIGPQGIVHGTVVRSWGKLWQHLLEEDFSPGGWLWEWVGLLWEELLAAKEILIACSIKNYDFFTSICLIQNTDVKGFAIKVSIWAHIQLQYVKYELIYVFYICVI